MHEENTDVHYVFYMLQVLAFAVLSSEVMSKPLDLGGLFNPTRGGLKK